MRRCCRPTSQDDGRYGLAAVPVKPYTTVTLPAPSFDKTINVAILGIGNHRVPNYELPSNIPGLTFTDPIATAKTAGAGAAGSERRRHRADAHRLHRRTRRASRSTPTSTPNLAAQTTGHRRDHRRAQPHRPEQEDRRSRATIKYLPTFVGAARTARR